MYVHTISTRTIYEKFKRITVYNGMVRYAHIMRYVHNVRQQMKLG